MAITFKLLVCVLCIYHISSEENRRVRVITKTLNYSNLNSILNALKIYGPTKRPGNVKNTTRQYTCTTVLAEEEVNDISWFTNSQFPRNFTENQRRIRVQYNENNNTDHGEKIVLRHYLDGLITQMQNDSKKRGYNIYPIVVMFSTNIPCSLKGHVCANLLKEDKEARLSTDTEYTMIVGFTTFFGFNLKQKYSNKQASFNSLKDGQIDVYMMLRDGFNNGQEFGSLVLTDIHIEQPVVGDTFQSILFGCLMGQPLVYCCISALDKIDVNEVKKIVSFSINSMVYTCRSEFNVNRNIQSKTCFEKWIDNNIGGDCVQCGGGTVGMWESKFFISQCIEQSADLKPFIGAMSNPYRLDDPFWTSEKIQWNLTPEGFRMNNALYCYNPKLNPGTFCTKEDIAITMTSRKRDRLSPLPLLKKIRKFS